MTTRTDRQQDRPAAQAGVTGTAVRTAARAGFTARGAIYVLVGVLALQIAFDDPGKEADRGGAVGTLAKQPLGSALVWALGIGLAGMALWRLSEATFGAAGPDGRDASRRLLSLARFAFYAFVAGSVIALAAESGGDSNSSEGGGGGGGGAGSTDKQSKDVTAEVLGLPAGRWLVALAGLVVVGAGVWLAVRAARRKFRKRLETGRMSARERRVVDWLGIAGGVSRGTVFAVAGGFAVAAAKDYDAEKAKGLDDTLRTFADTPAGPWLLAVVAVGLVLFGVFSFAMARWREL